MPLWGSLALCSNGSPDSKDPWQFRDRSLGKSCASGSARVWFSQNPIVHTPPVSPVHTPTRSGIYCNPASPEESGAEATSKYYHVVPLNEADRHYQLEDEELAFRAKQDEEEHIIDEDYELRALLDRGTGLSDREQNRLDELTTTKEYEKRSRIGTNFGPSCLSLNLKM
jgi:hypothetical protein